MSEAKLPSRYSLADIRKLGYGAVIVIFLFVFVWGGLAQISGAVVAPGRISVESSLKRIQHKEGGIVRDIAVQEGQHVQAGQVLARLDSTVVMANDAVIQNELWQLQARKWRLEAERDGRGRLQVPEGLNPPPAFASIVTTEQRLMSSRHAMREQKKSQLREQIRQSEQEVTGLAAQIQSQVKQRALILEELKGVRTLYNKGYAPLSRVSELEREGERLEGQRGELEASTARARTQASAVKLAVLQVDSEAASEVLNDLKETETRLGQLQQQEITSDDAMSRIELKAPVAGTVQQMTIHTRGGVVAPGETLMLIVPENDELIVEARIDPRKVDQVHKGGRAHIRFTAFDTRVTPESDGVVDSLSSDIETDEKTGVGYYRARLSLKGVNLPKGVQHRLVAGMPVEVQIKTSSRSALSYFLKPLEDQMHRTFKDS